MGFSILTNGIYQYECNGTGKQLGKQTGVLNFHITYEMLRVKLQVAVIMVLRIISIRNIQSQARQR